MLKQQKDECVLKEKKTRQFMEAVLTAAEHVSKERDQLLQMVSVTLPLHILHVDLGKLRPFKAFGKKEEAEGKNKLLGKCNLPY